MITKESSERFVFSNGGYQDFPNTTSVDTVEIVLISEYTPEQKTKSQLFFEEFTSLKSEYDTDIQSLNMAFASAAMVDGSAQESKQTTIRTQYNARKTEYDAAVAALRTKYYG